MALGHLVEAFAIDHRTRASSLQASTGTRASLAFASVQPDLALVPRRSAHPLPFDLAPAPVLSRHAFVACRMRDKGLRTSPCRLNAQWLHMYDQTDSQSIHLLSHTL